jgi:PhnB protein
MPVTISPWLSLTDPTAAVAFYERAFGAVVRERLDDDGGAVIVAQLAIDGATFWVQQDPDASAEAAGKSLVRMILSVDDPDAVFARALTAGAKEIARVADGHGWRIGRIADPGGHHWEIGKPLG